MIDKLLNSDRDWGQVAAALFSLLSSFVAGIAVAFIFSPASLGDWLAYAAAMSLWYDAMCRYTETLACAWHRRIPPVARSSGAEEAEE